MMMGMGGRVGMMGWGSAIGWVRPTRVGVSPQSMAVRVEVRKASSKAVYRISVWELLATVVANRIRPSALTGVVRSAAIDVVRILVVERILQLLRLVEVELFLLLNDKNKRFEKGE
jgi:hypothetical protein